MEINDIMTIFIYIFIWVIIISFSTGLVTLLINAGSVANCRMMKNNGHDTHLETYWFIFKDCYIKNVPYDRYMILDEEKEK